MCVGRRKANCKSSIMATSASFSVAVGGISQSKSEKEELMDEIAFYLYPVIRLVVSFGVVWFCSTFPKYVSVAAAENISSGMYPNSHHVSLLRTTSSLHRSFVLSFFLSF